MTRTQVIDSLAERSGMEKRDVKAFLDHLTGLIEQEMRNGGEVPLKGLGKFKVSHRKARIGRNPLTGEPINIAAKTVAKFTMAKALKDLVPST
ncbi:MAG: HU family DNA-binding protein [Acidobacteriota bacterium]|nr:HU family DNA-binding protein [Acidobacteriota bacterium]MDH3786612.1 HU family DNA-binding protein [Acidobacteriota bacterium]